MTRQTHTSSIRTKGEYCSVYRRGRRIHTGNTVETGITHSSGRSRAWGVTEVARRAQGAIVHTTEAGLVAIGTSRAVDSHIHACRTVFTGRAWCRNSTRQWTVPTSDAQRTIAIGLGTLLHPVEPSRTSHLLWASGVGRAVVSRITQTSEV